MCNMRVCCFGNSLVNMEVIRRLHCLIHQRPRKARSRLEDELQLVCTAWRGLFLTSIELEHLVHRSHYAQIAIGWPLKPRSFNIQNTKRRAGLCTLYTTISPKYHPARNAMSDYSNSTVLRCAFDLSALLLRRFFSKSLRSVLVPS